MTPGGLRTLSLRSFKAAAYCAIAGIVVLVAVPNPSFRPAGDPAVQAIGIVGLALVAIALIANLVSLVSGTMAWAKGAGRCPWILVCALVLLVPLALWVAISFNL